MIRKTVLGWLVIAAVLAPACRREPAGDSETGRGAEARKSRLQWDAQALELTMGPAADSLSADFAFRNDGPRAIGILSIETSCGCTTASADKTLYLPGERGTVRVWLRKRLPASIQEERVLLTTNELDHPSVTLRLKVTVPEPLKITPRLIVWGSGDKTATKTAIIEVPPGQALEIIGIESVPGDFSARTILDKENRIFLVHVAPRSTARPTAGKFVVLAADRAGNILRLPVYLRIAPAVAPGKEGGPPWNDLLWVDAQPAAAYGQSHIPGALPLTAEAWDAQFEPVLARWTPGKRIVVYGQTPAQASQVIERLKACGLENLFVIIPGD